MCVLEGSEILLGQGSMNSGPHGQTDDQTKSSGKTEPLPSNKNVGE